MRRRSVDLAECGSGIERVGELGPVQAVGRRAAVAEAKQRRIGRAGLSAGRIAVQNLLVENPDMRDAVDRPGRCDLDLARQIDIADPVFRGLRRGVGRAPILLEQFDRRGRGGAEIVVGHAHIEVKFRLIVLDADIAIEAPNVRCREITKAVVVQSFKRAVDGDIVDLLAPLRRALDAPERAAHRVDLGAVIVEAVLHLHVDRAAERIEAERGIVGHHA